MRQAQRPVSPLAKPHRSKPGLVEALRQDFGNTWLSALGDEGWETTTSSSVAQSLLDAGVVGGGDAPAGSGGLGAEAPTTSTHGEA